MEWKLTCATRRKWTTDALATPAWKQIAVQLYAPSGTQQHKSIWEGTSSYTNRHRRSTCCWIGYQLPPGHRTDPKWPM